MVKKKVVVDDRPKTPENKFQVEHLKKLLEKARANSSKASVNVMLLTIYSINLPTTLLFQFQ